MKSTLSIKIPLIIFAIGGVMSMAVAIVWAGNDFVQAQLRVDLPDIYNAKDYRVSLSADNIPNNGYPDFTTAWLGVDLAQGNGFPYSKEFSQVGLYAQSDGLHWFVYAEPGVTCLQGNPIYGPRGCEGTPADLVSLGTWHWMELVTYGNGYWIVRVYDASGIGHDVAKIWASSDRIYDAAATIEEGYSVSQDPYLTAAFHVWHPQYMMASGWKDWPSSAGGHDNYIYTTDLNGQNAFCPQYYGANPNEWNDERAWFAGTGGQQCSWPLFPSAHAYLPLVLKQPTPTPSPTPIPSPTPTPIPTQTPTNTPTPLPTLPPTPTQPPVAQCGQNALLNPGFESGLPGTPWTKYSSGGYPLISTSRPRTGSWGASLGGYNNALDRLYQGFTLPSGVTKATVTFWWYVVSQDSTTTPYDYLNVVIQSPPGNDLTGRNQVKNTDARGAWYQSAFDIPQLGPWAGSSLWFTIEATNDVSLPTSFYVDDVSFAVQCGGVSGLGGTPVSPLPTPTPHR